MRTPVETELAARDASNIVNRLKAAAFPVPKTLDSFDVAASSIQPKIFDYLSSLEWIRAQQNAGAHPVRFARLAELFPARIDALSQASGGGFRSDHQRFVHQQTQLIDKLVELRFGVGVPIAWAASRSKSPANTASRRNNTRSDAVSNA